MTDGGRPKDERPDPFAPLPLEASLTGETSQPAASATEPDAEATDATVPDSAVVSEPAPYDAPPAPDLTTARTSEPLLPSTYREDDLRLAVGATPRDETEKPKKKKKQQRAATSSPIDAADGGDDDGPRSRKGAVIGALTLVIGSGIAAMVIFGRINSARYVIACEANRMVVERGRAFPPWGTSALGGAEWRPLEIPPEAECHGRETENTAELATWYSQALIAQATALLAVREVTKVDEAEAQLKQALLVTRSLGTEDERGNARKDIERLLGDVGYWRASAKLRTASDALSEAAKEFDVAAAQRPRHVTDAAAWATFSRALVDELKAGPDGAKAAFPPLPPTDRPAAPPGVALPVEPVAGAGSGSAIEALPAPPDAGVPSGGVLL
ncbi:MAG TPA: hypothetical protein VM513_22310 [Kofleriaceae bacterium]|nr:hypothetical protein [Kofleriaceae bacterium]